MTDQPVRHSPAICPSCGSRNYQLVKQVGSTRYYVCDDCDAHIRESSKRPASRPADAASDSKTANHYICELCGGEYEMGWSDEEAEAEYSERFDEEYLAGADRAIVCDDCFRLVAGTES